MANWSPDPPDGRRDAGLGDPATGAPEMQAPTSPTPPRRGGPPAWAFEGMRVQASPPPSPPLAPPPPPEAPHDRNRYAPWALIAALGGAVLVGLVASIFLIGGDEEEVDADEPDVAGADVVECVTPQDPVDDPPLEAEAFYDADPWTFAVSDDETEVDQLGSWSHSECCDLGLADAQVKLNDAGCGYGIETAYETRDGHLGISQLILAFEDGSGARMAERDIQPLSFRLQSESGIYLEENELYSLQEATGHYLVLTVGAIDTMDDDITDDVLEVLREFHIEHLNALSYF